MTGAATERDHQPADLDRRLYAFVVDRLVAWTAYAGAGGAVVLAVPPGDHPVAGPVLAALTVLAIATGLVALLGRTGSSPGRAVAGLRLVDASTGAPVGVRRAASRQALVGLATLPTAGLGLAALAWTALTDPSGRRRGWHDLVTGAEVVDARDHPAVVVLDEEVRPRDVVNLTALRLVPASSAPPSAPPPRTPRGARAASSAPRPRGMAGGVAGGGWRIAFDTGECLTIDGPVLVGREPDPRPGERAARLVALPSADLSLSKTHAELRVAGDGSLVVTDRGSTNGTVLMRGGAARELPAGRATTLLVGDRLRLGDRAMQVLRESPAVPPLDDSITVR